MNHVAKTKQNGFTLIELMLAMTFISVLLLAIAMTIIQIGNIYNKGTTVKEINQAARAIADDVSRSASAASALNIDTYLRTNAAGGRLCLGTVTYIWNTAAAYESNAPELTKYPGANAAKRVNLVKVPDTTRVYCALNTHNQLTYANILAADVANAQELLPVGDHTLSVTQVAIPSSGVVTDPSTQQNLYTLMFTLGSGKVSAMNAANTECLPPSDPKSDINYCSVQQFTIVLRTGNRVN